MSKALRAGASRVDFVLTGERELDIYTESRDIVVREGTTRKDELGGTAIHS